MSRNSKPIKAELHLAFFWLCDDCGAGNFVRAEVSPASVIPIEEVAEEDRQSHVDAIADGDMVWSRPDKVMCSECGREFEAEDA